MNKKIIIIASACLVVLVLLTSAFLINKHRLNNAVVKVNADTFHYEFVERFSGNRWDLYMNGSGRRTASFSPYDGVTKEEMRQLFSDSKNMTEKYNLENVRVYSIKLSQENYITPTVIYTINGADFYCWNDDVEKSNQDAETNVRLLELYHHISESDLNEIIPTTPKTQGNN
jgi:hypothetical protein